jgi:hypothetical protein
VLDNLMWHTRRAYQRPRITETGHAIGNTTDRTGGTQDSVVASEPVSEVEDFIDFLSQRGLDQQVVQAAMAASQPALSEIWNNPEDAEYDQL